MKIIELKAIPPAIDPPKDVTIENCAVMLHRYLLTAREMEIIYNLVSSDYLVSATVTGLYASNNVVKSEITMNVLKWTVTAHKSRKSHKMNTIDHPTVQVLGAHTFIPRVEYHPDAWVNDGREVQSRPTMDDWALARSSGLHRRDSPRGDQHVPDRFKRSGS